MGCIVTPPEDVLEVQEGKDLRWARGESEEVAPDILLPRLPPLQNQGHRLAVHLPPPRVRHWDSIIPELPFRPL